MTEKERVEKRIIELVRARRLDERDHWPEEVAAAILAIPGVLIGAPKRREYHGVSVGADSNAVQLWRQDAAGCDRMKEEK